MRHEEAKRERRRVAREAAASEHARTVGDPPTVRRCPHCGAVATHESFAVGFSAEWQPICADYAQETEENQREVYEHEMSHFGGAYGLPDVRVRAIGSTDGEPSERGTEIAEAW